MLRRDLLQTLRVYRQLWAGGAAPVYPGWRAGEEEEALGTLLRFVEGEPACFARETAAGHVTGSALVVSPGLTDVLLTLHGKLGKWLQLGGHSDGDHRPHAVAFREAEEESGLKKLEFLRYENLLPGYGADTTLPWPLPFDLDAHHIPARKTEPEHVHYDVRYVVVADPAEPLVISSESKDLKWFPLAEARRLTDERSMLRQFDKLDWLRGLMRGRQG